VYKTQITQARAVKLYVEYLRAHNVRNRGAMYWQFADCCAATSFSAIDYQRQPKALYYYTRRFYAPLLVTAVPQYARTKHDLVPELQSLNLVVVNDTALSITASLAARLLDLDGNLLDATSLPTVISPHSASTPLKLPKNFVCPADPAASLLHIALAKDEKLLAENVFLYMPDKYINRPDLTIQYQLRRDSETQWKLGLTCQKPATDVRISVAAAATVSDNFFDMFPGRQYEVVLTTDHNLADISNPVNFRSTAHI
jgi:beta-mannosidase